MPSTGRLVCAVPSPAEARRLEPALSLAFNLGPKEAARWIRRAGRDQFRVALRGREVLGGLALHPMGHWFGGRSVPAVGVAGVAVLPEHRAAGVASFLMRESVREMARRRTAISGLFPATLPVYRRAGYEQAGSWIHYAVPPEALDPGPRDLAVRPARPADRPVIRALYGEVARGSAGCLDRTPYLWWRVFGRGKPDTRTYLVLRGKAPAGYVCVRQEEHEGPGRPYDLFLGDVAFTTEAAGRRILSFLAAHRSLAEEVHWFGGPADPLVGLLGEVRTRVKRVVRWMVRVVDLRAAVAARGYPPGLAAEVHLDVADDLLPGNAGRWVLRVAGGRGRAVRGGRGSVRVDVRTLAPIYTGFASPRELRPAGGVDGPGADLDALGALFAGPAPWMREGF